MKKLYLPAILVLSLSCTAPAVAPGNAVLTTGATATYADPEGRLVGSAYSNSVSVQVGQVAALTGLTYKVGDSLRGRSFSYYPVTLRNLGNGFDRFTLSLSPPAEGWTVRMVTDPNADGVLSPGENQTITSTPWIDANGDYPMLMELASPEETATTDGTQVVLTITSMADPNQRWEITFSGGLWGSLRRAYWFQLPDPVAGSVAVANEKVYVPTDRGGLFVYDIATGAPVYEWFHRVAGVKYQGQPAVHGDTLLVPVNDKRYAVFDLPNRTLTRFFSTAGGYNLSSNPVVVDDKAYLTALGQRMFSVTKVTNFSVASERFTTEASTSPTVAGKHLFIGCQDGSVSAIDSATMRVVWRVQVERNSPIVHRPIVDQVNKLVWVSTQSGTLYCINLNQRSIRYRIKPDSPIISGAMADGAVPGFYFVTQDRRMWGFNRITGRPIVGFPRQLPGTGSFTAQMVAVKRTPTSTPYLYVGSPDGNMFAVNANNGFTYYDYPGGVGWQLVFSGFGTPNSDLTRLLVAAQGGQVLGFETK